MDKTGLFYCLKCDDGFELDPKSCPQCGTPTIDRSRVPDAIIRINQLINRWRRIKADPFVVITHGGRETRV